MDIYAENIIDHYKNPRNFGKIKSPTIHHSEANHSCGDTMEIDMIITDDKIIDFKFSGEGCAISQSAISILSEELINMKISKAENLSKQDIIDILGIPVSVRRMKCALLGLLTIKNAIKIWKKKSPIKWIDII